MGAQRSDENAAKRVGKPVVKTNVLRDLKEERARREAQNLSRGCEKTIRHIDEVAKLGNEAYKRQGAVLDAAQTGNDPKINELAKKKAAVSISKKAPIMDCSGGVCRIVRKKKK